jgi:uncharacterized protein YdeI (YjbR/CyaY-like superfamily)
MSLPRAAFFETPADFRRWLKANHRTATELWVGYYKKATGRGGMTYKEAAEEALCFGWIDGIGKSLGQESHANRFTPRKKGSHWSAVNIARMKVLIARRRVTAAGRKAFEGRDPKKEDRYSYERRQQAKLTPAMQRAFRTNANAWKFFEALPLSHRKLLILRIIDAKQDATREKRLQQTIAICAAGRRVDFMRPMSKQI